MGILRKNKSPLSDRSEIIKKRREDRSKRRASRKEHRKARKNKPLCPCSEKNDCDD